MNREFVKCDYIFDQLMKNLRGIKVNQKMRRTADGTLIGSTYSHSMKDRKNIDICYWHDADGDLSYWSLEMKKSDFPYADPKLFLDYLEEKGTVLNNVEDRFGNRWIYSGIVPEEESFCILFFADEERRNKAI